VNKRNEGERRVRRGRRELDKERGGERRRGEEERGGKCKKDIG
jgi:hypothetical protein